VPTASPWFWSGLAVAAFACPVFLGLLSGRLPWVAPLFRDGSRAAWFPFWGTTAAWLWLVAAAVTLLMARGGISLAAVGLGRPSGLEAGIALAVALALGAGGLAVGARSSGPGPTDPEQIIFPHTTAERASMVLVLAPSAAVCEEAVYRGFLLVPLTVLIGFWPANGLQALLFAFHHGGHRQPPAAFVMRAAIGFAFGYIALKTGALLVVMALHFLFDAVLAVKPSPAAKPALA
jgi:membrane protease YdiL (CAAX protease family)